MSAKYWGTTHRHPFKWDDVAAAIFLRYPNPLATHVLTEDTLHRELKHKDLLYTRRFLTKTNKLPKWGERFFANLKKYVPLVEESVVDRKSKSIVTYTRNVGLSRFMQAVEKVSYKPDPQNPNETIAYKEAWVESGLYGLRSAVKNFGIERFKQNCSRATEGFNFVLHHLQHQQQHLKEMPRKKWEEMKYKSEVWREKMAFASSPEANSS